MFTYFKKGGESLMRPFIPTEVLMRETAELQKSVAADLQVPDPAPATIVTPPSKKVKTVNENPAKYDSGTGSIDDNQSVPPSGK